MRTGKRLSKTSIVNYLKQLEKLKKNDTCIGMDCTKCLFNCRGSVDEHNMKKVNTLIDLLNYELTRLMMGIK